jgi:hypothetical protein
MATTTPNYGWAVPTSTDLVKNGATAIETLGDAIDASMNTALGTKKAGMVLLNTTSFSAVSSQSISDVFSTTYDAYRIIVQTTDPASNQTFTMRLRVSGADDSSSTYTRTTGGTNVGGFVSVTGTTTSFFLGYVGGTSNYTGVLDVVNPFASKTTSLTGSSLCNNAAFNALTNWYSSGWFGATTSFTGFTLLFGANTTGTVSVYGVNK